MKYSLRNTQPNGAGRMSGALAVAKYNEGSVRSAMTSILEKFVLGAKKFPLARRRARLRRCRCRRLLHLLLSHGAKKIGNHPLPRSFIVEGKTKEEQSFK